jgi:hypothetical protein
MNQLSDQQFILTFFFLVILQPTPRAIHPRMSNRQHTSHRHFSELVHNLMALSTHQLHILIIFQRIFIVIRVRPRLTQVPILKHILVTPATHNQVGHHRQLHHLPSRSVPKFVTTKLFPYMFFLLLYKAMKHFGCDRGCI